jgi:hypothetical protein
MKPVAIYYPQYHEIQLNNETWGSGFTDWTNVKRAQPLFEGHYQPHVPHKSVGYYDLNDPEVLVKQAEMARSYGIYGFAFYHYWFHGERLLEKPLDNMLRLGKPDFPFFYIWANETWTKTWDRYDNTAKKQIIKQQKYSDQDDIEHMTFLCKNVFSDKRYMTINHKPIFAIAAINKIPNPKKTIGVWRQICKNFGFKDIFIIKTNKWGDHANPNIIGSDMAMEIAPNLDFLFDHNCHCKTEKYGVFDYLNYLKARSFNKDIVNYFSDNGSYHPIKTIFPGWDNSSRRKNNFYIFQNATIENFEKSLKNAIDYTKQYHAHGIFLMNAWNEWAEGCHIEPDIKNGYAYLETIKRITQKN